MARNETLEFLYDTFEGCYSNRDTIKRTTGIINYVVEDSHDTLADVQIGTKHLILLNKSGEILEEGDHVWVYYWNSIADGYIALRCGEAKNIGGGIKNAGVLTERQDTVYDIAKEVAIVDTENKAKAYYTNTNNIILVDKYTAVAMTTDTYPDSPNWITWETDTDGAVDLRQRVADMNSRLWSNEIKSYWIPNGSGFSLGTEYTYTLQVDFAEFVYETPIGGQLGWIYYLGIFCKETGWHSRVPNIFSETLSGMEDCGLITIYDSITPPTSNIVGDISSKPTLHGALGVCVGANSHFYGQVSSSPTPTYRQLSGLVYGTPLATMAMYNIDEYNYAISLTTDRDIVSSGL